MSPQVILLPGVQRKQSKAWMPPTSLLAGPLLGKLKICKVKHKYIHQYTNTDTNIHILLLIACPVRQKCWQRSHLETNVKLWRQIFKKKFWRSNTLERIAHLSNLWFIIWDDIPDKCDQMTFQRLGTEAEEDDITNHLEPLRMTSFCDIWEIVIDQAKNVLVIVVSFPPHQMVW